MKYYKYTETDNNTKVLSEEQIIESYYPMWSKKMKEIGKDSMISRENCIEDWCAAHWAHEVQMLNENF